MCKKCEEVNFNRFVHLHVHTEKSDGACTVREAVERAVELGMPALAITDHGTTGGHIDLYDASKELGIKGILGMEGYFRFNDDDGSGMRHHMTILSDGSDEGTYSLIELNNLSAYNGERGKSGQGFHITTMDIIREITEGRNHGLKFLTGCFASPIYSVDKERGEWWVSQLIRYAGKENIFAEMQYSMVNDIRTIKRPMEIADKFGIKEIWTNDCHLLRPEDRRLHIITQKGKKAAGMDVFDNSLLHMAGGEEVFNTMESKLGHDKAVQVFNNTCDLAESLSSVDVPEVDPVLPNCEDEIPEYINEIERRFTEDKKRYPVEKHAEMDERFYDLERELIDRKGYWNYFYPIYDCAQFAKSKGIYMATRGSAAGCYILYLSDVTTVSPIDYPMLSFQRFLNDLRLEANELPDVDVDVATSGRDEVLDYMKERWGMFPVCSISTLTHDACINFIVTAVKRLVESNPNDGWVTDKFSTLQVERFAKDAKNCADSQEAIDDPEMVANLPEMQRMNEYIVDFTHYYLRLVNTMRGYGTHACAIISTNALAKYPLPLVNPDGKGPKIGLRVSGSFDEAVRWGGVKYDMLGLRALSVTSEIKNTLKDKIPVDYYKDPKIYEVFKERERMVNMFQMGSWNIRNTTAEMDPDDLGGVSDVLATHRPGPLRNGFQTLYGDNKKAGINKADFLPDDLQWVVEPTYATIIYQEQVAQILGAYSKYAGTKLAMAYGCKLLKVIVPKNQRVAQTEKFKKAYEEARLHFMESAEEQGRDIKQAENLWEIIQQYVGYSFNYAHSLQYAMHTSFDAWSITYQAPLYYTKQLGNITSSKSTIKRILEVLVAAVKEGVELSLPHINYSGANWELRDNEVMVMPLQYINQIGESGIPALISKREEFGGKFETFEQIGQIPSQLLNKTQRYNIWALGGFEGIEGEIKHSGIFETNTWKRGPKNLKEDWIYEELEEGGVFGYQNGQKPELDGKLIQSLVGYRLPNPQILEHLETEYTTVLDSEYNIRKVRKPYYIVDTETVTTASGTEQLLLHTHLGEKLKAIVKFSSGHGRMVKKCLPSKIGYEALEATFNRNDINKGGIYVLTTIVVPQENRSGNLTDRGYVTGLRVYEPKK